jgi:hypothetical protein
MYLLYTYSSVSSFIYILIIYWTRALRSVVSGRLATEFRLAGDVPGGMADYRLALVIGFFHRFFADVECSLGKETNFAKETSGKEVEGTNCDEREEDAEIEECPPVFVVGFVLFCFVVGVCYGCGSQNLIKFS